NNDPMARFKAPAVDPTERFKAPTEAEELPSYLQPVSFTTPGSSAAPMMAAPVSNAGYVPTTVAQPPVATFDVNDAMKMYYEQQRRRNSGWSPYSLGGYGTVGSED